MSRNTLDLSTQAWRFGLVARQPFGPWPQDDRSAVRDWLPARIPGDIRADLIAAGRIPAVESPAGIAAGAWVDDSDGWYVTELTGSDATDEQTILEADGIDYHSAVWPGRSAPGDPRGHVFPSGDPAFRRGSTRPALTSWRSACGGGGALPRLPNPLGAPASHVG